MTNQASEDEKAIMIGFLYGIQSDFLSADEVKHRMAWFRHTQGYEDAIELIRTEKLKLLAEVRERVVGEDDEQSLRELSRDIAYEVATVLFEINTTRNVLKREQRESLEKMEAEL